MPGVRDRPDGRRPYLRVFVDTNIWIHTHLRTLGDARHSLALQRLESEPAKIISPQVVAEYDSVMPRNGQTDAWIQANLRAIFARTQLQVAAGAVPNTALALRQRYGFSFWDCLIAAAALESGCELLPSEDLQHGQLLDGRPQVVNPFARGRKDG